MNPQLFCAKDKEHNFHFKFLYLFQYWGGGAPTFLHDGSFEDVMPMYQYYTPWSVVDCLVKTLVEGK